VASPRRLLAGPVIAACGLLGPRGSRGCAPRPRAGKPKNASLPLYKLTLINDSSWITLPAGGVGNFTFTYVIPPGLDDMSVAVVMDASPRPPPPPSPPGPPGSSCACPLRPLQTIGGSATACNATFATMKVSLANDSSTFLLQCVPYPNYGASRCGLSRVSAPAAPGLLFPLHPRCLSEPRDSLAGLSQAPGHRGSRRMTCTALRGPSSAGFWLTHFRSARRAPPALRPHPAGDGLQLLLALRLPGPRVRGQAILRRDQPGGRC
jgi:hypothetical protein